MCGSEESRVLGRRLNGSQGRGPRNKTGISTTVMKCQNCGLIYANPLPIPDSINDHYGVPPESYWTEQYFQVNPEYFSEELERLQTLLPFKQGMKALDIGAGIGKFMLKLQAVGWDTYGFEPSEPFYDRAITRMNVPAERLQLASIDTASYAKESFDFISFGAVLEHLYDPSEAIQKALLWLKPEGIIYVQVPSSDWLISKFANIYFKLKATDYVTHISPMHVPFHLYEFTLKSFEKHAINYKYTIAFHEYHSCETGLPKPLHKVLTYYMDTTHTGMQLAVYLRKNCSKIDVE
jgi:SAM-dependent methyltransferase